MEFADKFGDQLIVGVEDDTTAEIVDLGDEQARLFDPLVNVTYRLCKID